MYEGCFKRMHSLTSIAEKYYRTWYPDAVSLTKKLATRKKKYHKFQKYRRSKPIRCLVRRREETGPLCLRIQKNNLSPRYLCYMYRAKHMYETIINSKKASS